MPLKLNEQGLVVSPWIDFAWCNYSFALVFSHCFAKEIASNIVISIQSYRTHIASTSKQTMLYNILLCKIDMEKKIQIDTLFWFRHVISNYSVRHIDILSQIPKINDFDFKENESIAAQFVLFIKISFRFVSSIL